MWHAICIDVKRNIKLNLSYGISGVRESFSAGLPNPEAKLTAD